jgi:hypothetical protein
MDCEICSNLRLIAASASVVKASLRAASRSPAPSCQAVLFGTQTAREAGERAVNLQLEPWQVTAARVAQCILHLASSAAADMGAHGRDAMCYCCMLGRAISAAGAVCCREQQKAQRQQRRISKRATAAKATSLAELRLEGMNRVLNALGRQPSRGLQPGACCSWPALCTQCK